MGNVLSFALIIGPPVSNVHCSNVSSIFKGALNLDHPNIRTLCIPKSKRTHALAKNYSFCFAEHLWTAWIVFCWIQLLGLRCCSFVWMNLVGTQVEKVHGSQSSSVTTMYNILILSTTIPVLHTYKRNIRAQNNWRSWQAIGTLCYSNVVNWCSCWFWNVRSKGTPWPLPTLFEVSSQEKQLQTPSAPLTNTSALDVMCINIDIQRCLLSVKVLDCSMRL